MKWFRESLSTKLDSSTKIRWTHEHNEESKHEGEYEGALKNGKPDGLGRWTGLFGKIEAEWKGGKIDGRAVHHQKNCRQEFEMKDGRYHGLSILYWDGGRRLEREFTNGKLHGREREGNKNGTIYQEDVYEEGSWVKRVR